jgi:integrase
MAQHNTTHNRLRPVDLLRLPVGDHPDGGGLYLQIRQGTGGLSRSWLFRFTRNGRQRYMGLGPLHTRSLAEARQRARDARKLLLDGIDPIDARDAHRATQRVSAATTITFEKAAERYIDAQSAGWRGAKVESDWRGTLRDYAFPALGALPVAAIDTGLVMRAIEELWKTKTETASRLRGRIENVLDWATTRGFRQGENPARWKGHLENLLPKRSKVRRVEHHAALPYPDMPGFMTDLRQRGGAAARAFELAILCASRSGEVINAKWSEFDLAERVWIIPASRMKAGREHRVPLSDAAMAILEQMMQQAPFGLSGINPHVFPGRGGGKPLDPVAFFRVLRRMGRGELTAHGFRSSFRDWCAERTAFPSEVAEMALAHTVGDKVEAAYRRGDLFQKRRGLMEAWSGFCTGEAGGKVVRLAR